MNSHRASIQPSAAASDFAGWLAYAGSLTLGVLTVWCSLFALPLGVAFVAVDAVLAVASRGGLRRLLAGFAIAGAVLCGSIAVGFLAATSTTEMGPLSGPH